VIQFQSVSSDNKLFFLKKEFKSVQILVLFIIVAVTFIACKKFLPDAPPSSETIAEPIEGLTNALAIFMQGDASFDHTYTPEAGLGPIFIQQACAGCHIGDGKWHPLNTVTRFEKTSPFGFDCMLIQGGHQLQQRAINNYLAEVLPSGYTHSSDCIAPIVIGTGLLAALHDNTILSMADPDLLAGEQLFAVLNVINQL
jgi:hypothetical protein